MCLRNSVAKLLGTNNEGAHMAEPKTKQNDASVEDFINALADELPGKAASLRWVVPNLNTTLARLRIVARDGADNLGEETHDGTFSIEIRPDRPALLRA